MNPKLHGWLATARIANVPSVISNVWLGIALGAWVCGAQDTRGLLLKGAVLALSGVLLYIGGNFFNDWHDREWDAKHRPERALPSGLFTPLSYQLRAIRFIGLGVIFAFLMGWPCAVAAGAIAVLIVIYTRWHKKAVWPVIPMGLCRALLPVLGFLSVVMKDGHLDTFAMARQLLAHDDRAFVMHDAHALTLRAVGIIALHAAGLFCYIVGLSLNARYESVPNPPALPRQIARILIFMPLVFIGGFWLPRDPIFTLAGAVPFLAWTIPLLVRRHSVQVTVSGFLAGIPLVEWIAAFPIAMALVPAGNTLWAHPVLVNTVVLPALAFMTGRRLQAVASAT
ncbi:UbiA family prenyltransferase [Luteolibacter ambystomatis]|uniref:UbiA family prenyltransferase n=1 Tax=Luteolibacter ambystomatis TaxID=2824561 RepID=A0A975J027_9BACT|nr:UbiA family prenyltransferase [Luteolibacter ambystomatis]QUE51435.1 UbiA family prenyltransferase [Luteolibacter ambystomatis]